MPQLRFGQDDVWFEVGGVRCGLSANRKLPASGGTRIERALRPRFD